MSEDVGRVSISEEQALIIMELLEYESIRCEVVKDTKRMDAVNDVLSRTQEQMQQETRPHDEQGRATSYLAPNTCTNCNEE